MSKKRKRKNKNKSLSWAKFIRKYCSKCTICTSNIDAKFCYGMYINDNTRWQDDIFPVLSESKLFTNANNRGVSGKAFMEIFCSRCSACNPSNYFLCDSFITCRSAFSKQIRDSISEVDNRPAKKQKDVPKPVFFTNNPEKWDIIIRKTLYGETE